MEQKLFIVNIKKILCFFSQYIIIINFTYITYINFTLLFYLHSALNYFAIPPSLRFKLEIVRSLKNSEQYRKIIKLLVH